MKEKTMGGMLSPTATVRKRQKGDRQSCVTCSHAQPQALQGKVRTVPHALQLPWRSLPNDSQRIAAMVFPKMSASLVERSEEVEVWFVVVLVLVLRALEVSARKGESNQRSMLPSSR